jgi:hypothetical protein
MTEIIVKALIVSINFFFYCRNIKFGLRYLLHIIIVHILIKTVGSQNQNLKTMKNSHRSNASKFISL